MPELSEGERTRLLHERKFLQSALERIEAHYQRTGDGFLYQEWRNWKARLRAIEAELGIDKHGLTPDVKLKRTAAAAHPEASAVR